MPDSEQIRSAVNAYVDSFNKQDRAGFLAALADGVEQFEPVGAPVNRGKEALAAFWDQLFGQCEKIDFAMLDLIITGDEAAMSFRIDQLVSPGRSVRVEGIDTFRVDDQGKITLIKGYSDGSHIRTPDGTR
jgi:steroid delta-isomerase